MRNIQLLALLLCLALLCGCSLNPSPATTQNAEPAPSVSQTTQGTGSNYIPKHALSNPNATEAACRVYDFLCDLAGNRCLSGQQESTWMGSADYEMDIIYNATGKLPAIRGLDYMHDDFAGVNQRAIAWWKQGGLVTIMWHTGSDFYGEWSDCMEDTVSDWDAVLTEGTEENAAFVAGMDKAAQALLELQEAGVPVIWRPFHEFDGRWFWWGKGGSDNFIKLWQLMYDRYTNYWGLNNLIWVLPYSGNGIAYSRWYPGDEYCDIVGADSYGGGAQNRLYQLVDAVCSTKPHCFHECGTNPTAEELQATPWIWFMTWHTTYVTDSNTPEALNALYNSDYVLTLDELPSFQ